MRAVLRIGVLSAGKVFGVLYALLGLVFGGLFALTSTLGAVAGAGVDSLLFGIGAIIFAPILYGILGFIFGVILALFYNITAGLVGGIEIEVSKH